MQKKFNPTGYLPIIAVVFAAMIPSTSYAQRITNGDFSTGTTTGFTIVGSGGAANFVNLGVTTFPKDPSSSGSCTSVDTSTYPGSSPGNDDTQPTSGSFSASVTADPLTNSGQVLKLDTGSIQTVPYGVVHGPAAVSNAFSASANDVINFRYLAQGGGDDYAVVGYLMNTSSCAFTELLDDTGTSNSSWQNVTYTIPSAGTYQFVFVNGTFDRSGGQAAGAVLYVDDIAAGQPQTITFAQPASQAQSSTLALSATASSGLAVTFESTTPSVCTVSGSVASFPTAGTCSITAKQNGDATFASASPVTRSFSVTSATAPGSPTGVTAQPLEGAAKVFFTAPASDGGSAITSYTITASPGGLTATGTTSPITITGLTNGTSYTFTVTATNGVGAGSASSASGAVTPAIGVPTMGGWALIVFALLMMGAMLWYQRREVTNPR
jgi:Fibronectin type III domain